MKTLVPELQSFVAEVPLAQFASTDAPVPEVQPSALLPLVQLIAAPYAVPVEQPMLAEVPPLQSIGATIIPAVHVSLALPPSVQVVPGLVPTIQSPVAPCGIKRFLLRPKDSGLSSKGGV